MNKTGVAITSMLVSILVICLILGGFQGTITADNGGKKDTSDAVLQETAKIPEPEVKTGNYTIFQYCQNGWTNHLYAVSYFEKDHHVYAELREYQGEYIPVDGQTLIIPEYIEDVNELMDYGFWEPAEADW
ncbi:MAG TPA: hypothetical protein VN549_03650 [Negativicutes bacterium]|nr:hypothetical protein [Negativicutes bacterium]